MDTSIWTYSREYTAEPIDGPTILVDVAVCAPYHNGIRLLVEEQQQHRDGPRFVCAEAIMLPDEVHELIRRLQVALERTADA